MNMKKLVALTLALICLSALIVGGTMAQVIDRGAAHNVITTNGFDIQLNEWADDAKTEPFKDLSNVVPSISYKKIVEVENLDNTEAWIRIKLTKDIQLAPGKSGEVDLDLVKLDINEKDWVESGGYYYYKTPLDGDKTTSPLFTTVTFDPTMGNLYQQSKATVKVEVQAVQVANNGDTVFEAQGWPTANS